MIETAFKDITVKYSFCSINVNKKAFYDPNRQY